MNETLPAKCPHCGGKGCDFCLRGQVIFSMPTEFEAYTRKCNNCGFENGMLCVGEQAYPKENFKNIKNKSPGKCINCKSLDTKWLRI